jgi:hypothetical protein
MWDGKRLWRYGSCSYIVHVSGSTSDMFCNDSSSNCGEARRTSRMTSTAGAKLFQ